MFAAWQVWATLHWGLFLALGLASGVPVLLAASADARRVLPQLPRRSLDHLARYYGVDFTARHRAGGDARATARVLIRLLREVYDRGCHTWPELESLLTVPHRGRRRRRRSAMPHPMDRDTTA